jgi:hypothetical protein
MSVDDAELIDRLEKLGASLVEARAGYTESRAWTDDLVTEMDGGLMSSIDTTKQT